MKLLILLLLIFICFVAFSQEKEFHIQARVIDSKSNPVGDVYILNYRKLDKVVSRQNGVFDIWVLPEDSLMISHVSYVRKIVKVFDLMVNPEVKIEMDTINILQVNVSPEQKTDLERAQENIKAMKLDPRPLVTDGYTEQEMMQEMINRENKVLHSEATSLKIYKFSPSEIIGAISQKIKKKKYSNQFYSKKRYKKNYPDESE